MQPMPNPQLTGLSEEGVNAPASFLQESAWAEFQQKLGREIWHVADASFVEGTYSAQLYLHRGSFGQAYWYCPRGPHGKLASLGQFAKDIQELARKEHAARQAMFVRVEPPQTEKESARKLLEVSGWRVAPRTIQPHITSIVDVAQAEENIFNQMHPKTRYNIRVAQRHGIEVRTLENIDTFLNLLHETAQRDEFYTHPDDYYKKLYEHFSTREDVRVMLWGAFLKEEILAANLVIYYGEIATYLHGASASRSRNAMAPYILHWEIMKHAHAHGYTQYDLWGIDPKRWPGLTRFKSGFGGKTVEYVGAYDLVLRPVKYWLYKILS